VKDVSDKLKDLLAQLKLTLSKGTNWLARKWRRSTPGFRYALVYFLCVLAIAGLVWWQFKPLGSLVFDPGGAEKPGEDPDLPGEPPDGPDQPGLSLAAFRQGQETLSLPLEGPVLLGFGQVFSGSLYGVNPGVHIGGTRGDSVCAAYRGRVSKVVPAGEYQAGQVWIVHGDFETRYINLEDVSVHEGETVDRGQPIGELGPKLEGDYVEDYLIFEVRDALEDPSDPLEYLGLGL